MVGIAWIIANKDWLFAGAGLSLVSGIGWAWRRWQRNRRQRSREAPLDFDDVVTQVSSVPPSQQPSAWRTYSGLPVTVRGRLLHVRKGAGGLIHVSLHCQRHRVPVRFRVSRVQHPRLAVAARKSRLVVVGTLSPSYPDIELTDPEIELTDVTTVEVS